ncbi:hypothetical protein [Actinomadura sp. DC4]|uniref:hypothetical protein n=1 Tax=Actinomadura sp. DC4 TaxID=3055069 RepID=UPI0025B15E98|nr:hypothetical protein [Actinomadura sp. DC4]MDN3353420.1 hypothetical protein [Actinomadura sp. DC4]
MSTATNVISIVLTIVFGVTSTILSASQLREARWQRLGPSSGAPAPGRQGAHARPEEPAPPPHRPRGFANGWIALVAGIVLVAVVSLLVDSRTGQAATMSLVLALVILIWLVRRVGWATAPSESLAGLLALLMLLSGALAIIALPLPHGLRWPQLALACVVPALVVTQVMRKLAP